MPRLVLAGYISSYTMCLCYTAIQQQLATAMVMTHTRHTAKNTENKCFFLDTLDENGPEREEKEN